MTIRYIHAHVTVKDETAFKRSRFTSRFPFLEIELFEKDVYVTDGPVVDDITKFVNGIAKHVTKGSWIGMDDLDEKKTIVYRFDGDGSFVTIDVEYDPTDQPDEYMPDDIEFVMSDVTDNIVDTVKEDKPVDKKDDIFV